MESVKDYQFTLYGSLTQALPLHFLSLFTAIAIPGIGGLALERLVIISLGIIRVLTSLHSLRGGLFVMNSTEVELLQSINYIKSMDHELEIHLVLRIGLNSVQGFKETEWETKKGKL